MKSLRMLLFILPLLSLTYSCNFSAPSKKEGSSKVSVAVVFPVTIDAFDQLKSGLREVLNKDIDVINYSAEGDPDKFETVVQTALLKHPQYLVTVGSQLTNIAFGPQFKNKLPVIIASAISSPKDVNALVSIGIDTPRSFSAAIISDSPKESIYSLFSRSVKELLPNAKSAGIIYSPGEINSKVTSQAIENALSGINIKVIKGALSGPDDIDKVTQSLLLNKVDLVIIPHDKYAVTKAASIVKSCKESNVPVFSLDDGTVGKDGVTAGVSVNYHTIGKLIAATINQIQLKKVTPERLPVIAIDRAMIYVNSKMISSFSITVPSDLKPVTELVK